LSSKIIKVDGHEIEISHLDKMLFPKSTITKGDIVSYYEDLSSLIVPLYENHALTMVRCPEGIQGQQFIQKNVPPYFPKWIDTYTVTSEERKTKYALVNNKSTLLYLVNQACISFHLSLSKIDKFHYPSYLIFDLDPSIDDLQLLKSVVMWTKDLLDNLGLPSFLQTTGSKGFHIYVPIKRDVTFETSHAFVRECADHLAREHPNEITIEFHKSKRGKKVLVDHGRNSYGFNNIAPYSLRPIENAPLATPIHWDELENKELHPQSYNLKNIRERLKTVENPWKDLFSQAVSLKSFMP
jgi:bifunctional non-homologous end joining protein LigD